MENNNNVITILVVIEGIFKFMNNLDWNGRLNIILISICVGFVIWVYNHRTETKVTRNEKEKPIRKNSKNLTLNRILKRHQENPQDADLHKIIEEGIVDKKNLII